MYAILALGVGVVGESAALWYLWGLWRAAKNDAMTSAVAVGAAVEALGTAYEELADARAALAKQNDLEAKADAKTIAGSPGLNDAVTRINGL